jgi:hypothetical protein
MAKGSSAGTSLVAWDKKLAEMASMAKSIEDSVQMGSKISFKSGVMSFNGAPFEGNHMESIVLDHVLMNVLYEGEFDPENPSSPVCFAFGRADKDMKPHEKSTKPQHATCKSCPMNEFGTADRGKGKACKNIRRLGLIAADVLEKPSTIPDAQVAYAEIPVTSVKGWAAYVNKVAEVMKRPPLGVVTDISLIPDAKSQFKVLFKCVDTIKTPSVIGALIPLAEQVAKEIDYPFIPFEDNEEFQQKAKPKKKAVRKF